MDEELLPWAGWDLEAEIDDGGDAMDEDGEGVPADPDAPAARSFPAGFWPFPIAHLDKVCALLASPDFPQELLAALATSSSTCVREAVAERASLSPVLAVFLAEDPDAGVRAAAAANPALPDAAAELLLTDQDALVRSCVAYRPVPIPPSFQAVLAEDASPEAQRALSSRTDILPSAADALAARQDLDPDAALSLVQTASPARLAVLSSHPSFLRVDPWIRAGAVESRLEGFSAQERLDFAVARDSGR